MSEQAWRDLEVQRRRAVDELIALIKGRYPTASFQVGPGVDDPDSTHIIAMVDTEDPDEVLDLVLEREMALQIDEGIPVYVIPIQPPERSLTAMGRAIAHHRSSASVALERLEPPQHVPAG